VLRFRDGLLAEMWTSTDVTLPTETAAPGATDDRSSVA